MNDPRAVFHHYTAPPTFRVALAERVRLRDALRAASERRVVLIDAPAGYGKTWLMSCWFAELRAAGTRVAWLGVEEADSAQFLALAVAGLARAGAEVGRLEALAAQGFADVPAPAAVAALAAALSAEDVPLVIFVDDLHRLPREVVQDVLARLVSETPPNVRFAMSGRDTGALPHAALRARGELFELGAEDLRFGPDEARELLPALAPAELERLLDRTEGWPVALQLARLWLEARPGRAALLDAFSGRTSEVAEYLTEQVLADLPPDLQQVLAQVAVLDSLNPELAAAVTGSPAAWRRLLDEGRLEHFLVPLDAERYWFRLHHLLRDFLRARNRELGGDMRPLHGRAATWFERHGELPQAVRHAVLADDVPRAAALLERTGGWEMVLFGGAVRMRELLGLLPPERLAEFPRVQLSQAFLAAKEGDLARGLRLFESVSATSADDDPALVGEALPFALKTYESLLAELPDDGPLLLASCRGFVSYAAGWIEAEAERLESVDYDSALVARRRALGLHLRARDYCLHALELRSPGVGAALRSRPDGALGWALRDDVERLYWTAAAWGSAIALPRPARARRRPARRAGALRACPGARSAVRPRRAPRGDDRHRVGLRAARRLSRECATAFRARRRAVGRRTRRPLRGAGAGGVDRGAGSRRIPPPARPGAGGRSRGVAGRPAGEPAGAGEGAAAARPHRRLLLRGGLTVWPGFGFVHCVGGWAPSLLRCSPARRRRRSTPRR